MWHYDTIKGTEPREIKFCRAFFARTGKNRHTQSIILEDGKRREI